MLRNIIFLACFVLISLTKTFAQTTPPKDSLIDSGVIIHSSNHEDLPFPYVEQMPVYKDGQEGMYKFLAENIQYPVTAKKNGVEGYVVVQFVVNREGNLEDVRVVRGVDSELDMEAVRVINLMSNNAWRPGKHNGRPVPVRFTLPISFKLKSR